MGHREATSMTAPQCRWFRFSLRTLFVVVTVLCAWLGWNLPTVAERSRIQRRDGVSCIVIDPTRYIRSGKPLPISWRILGAASVDFIDLDSDTFDGDDLKHVRDI